jgi:hypothetical protein
MKILCTENKNLNPVSDNLVRVFVDGDYNYGYWVDEAQLFDMLTPDQKNDYVQKSQIELDVANEVAQKIIEIGLNPYKK